MTKQELEALSEREFLAFIGTYDAADVDNIMTYLRAGAPEALAAAMTHANEMRGEPERIPWPTGFCGHPVHPGAWALGLTRCHECIEAVNAVSA